MQNIMWFLTNLTPDTEQRVIDELQTTIVQV